MYCFGADRTGTRVGMATNILMEKNSKIISETTGSTALIFGMMVLINRANHATGVKFGHTPGVDSLHKLTTTGKPSNFPIGSLFLCK